MTLWTAAEMGTEPDPESGSFFGSGFEFLGKTGFGAGSGFSMV